MKPFYKIVKNRRGKYVTYRRYFKFFWVWRDSNADLLMAEKWLAMWVQQDLANRQNRCVVGTYTRRGEKLT